MTPSKERPLNLALQGGGAHGAYTWGVLDRLLEEESLYIEGMSGTSAGAMNAVVCASGLTQGGRAGAKEALERFWWRVAELNPFGFLNFAPQNGPFANWNLDRNPLFAPVEMALQLVSPYLLNPFNVNPLKGIIEDVVDFSPLNEKSPVKLFIAATRVRDGHAKIFKCGQLSTDVVLASACLPMMFQAVEVEGDHYWDGGYMGNPVIWPLIYYCESLDVLLVQLNPMERPDVPVSATDIMNRLNEVTFNSSLIAEMRAIHFVQKLVHDNKLDPKKYKSMRMHMIQHPEEMLELNASSKLNASWAFFEYLKLLGRNSAENWLEEHREDVGVRSSTNIEEVFLAK